MKYKNKNIWQELQLQAKTHLQEKINISSLFNIENKSPNDRYKQFFLKIDDEIKIDFSKTNISTKTRQMLVALAQETEVKNKIQLMFQGEKINFTQKQAALHTELRAEKKQALNNQQKNRIANNKTHIKNMEKLCNDLYSGKICNQNGERFINLVHIGVGGAYLGNIMAVKALKDFEKNKFKIYFINNITNQIDDLMEKIQPEKTIFIIASKSFTTIETITNARIIIKILEKYIPRQKLMQQFFAITNQTKKALQFGISKNNILKICKTTGGRFSICSNMGFTLMLSVGPENFRAMLQGANQIDQHFYNTDIIHNAPVMLALNSLWQNYFLKSKAQAVIPYCYRLRHLPQFLQQLEMESNGKHIDNHGNKIPIPPAPIIFGDTGTNAQHSFCQYLLQTPVNINVEFLIAAQSNAKITKNNQDELIIHYISQAELLAFGTSGQKPEYLNINGNKSSITILFKKITPQILGKIIALYEHKTFTLSCLLDTNCFDQWGVESAKKYIQKNKQNLHSAHTKSVMDSINEMRHTKSKA